MFNAGRRSPRLAPLPYEFPRLPCRSSLHPYGADMCPPACPDLRHWPPGSPGPQRRRAIVISAVIASSSLATLLPSPCAEVIRDAGTVRRRSRVLHRTVSPTRQAAISIPESGFPNALLATRAGQSCLSGGASSRVRLTPPHRGAGSHSERSDCCHVPSKRESSSHIRSSVHSAAHVQSACRRARPD
jgi:hypothetical protein